MYETGVYKYIYNKMNPKLMQCEFPRTYHSAGLLDLTSAFSILLVGQFFGLILVFLEYLWKRRAKLFSVVVENDLKKLNARNRLPFIN